MAEINAAANQELSASGRRKKWTDERIRHSKEFLGQADRRVLVEPNLYLRVRETADPRRPSKHWEYRAQVDGKRRWISLGGFPGVGYAEARRLAMDLHQAHQRALAGLAEHPVLLLRQERKAKKGMPTVAEAFDLWMEDKRMGSPRKGGKPVRERTIFCYTQPFDGDIRARVGELKIATVTPEALRECIDAPRKRGSPGAAANVYKTLRGLINFAIARGYITGADPMRGITNPKPYRPAFPNAASDEELVAFMKALDNSHLWPATRDTIYFQLLTGLRPGEARLARVKFVDEEAEKLYLIPDRVKTDRPFTVHLSRQALEILERAKQYRGESEYLFPGADGKAMAENVLSKALRRLTEQAEKAEQPIRKQRPHDLRKTFRTMLSRLGVAPHIAELCLNHTEKEVMRRVYDGHNYLPEMIKAWDLAGAHIESLRNGGAVVIPLFKTA